ncbi:MAG: peptide chain release factor N(5)-glutamine methyltransferase [Elusimicrobiota bacterium]|jgi:release factor glutamine methyltransferase|nr:peptide chain release factor N(5)-glutamine methyltransferase [Elusimicrobiota bacterium]
MQTVYKALKWAQNKIQASISVGAAPCVCPQHKTTRIGSDLYVYSQYKIDAEFLLSAVLNVKRTNLPLIRQEKLTPTQLKQFKKYIARRVKREPVSYILGSCEFMGLDFKVNQSVLIPRPETELLVEEVLKIASKFNKKSVLDLCCGSGAIAVSLSKIGAFKDIVASDINKDALKIAKENSLKNQSENIEFIESDMFEDLRGKSFDIIVSNPPYISKEEFENLKPELHFEPHIALFADDGGFFFYKKIAQEARKYLNTDGYLLIELNSNLSCKIKEIFEKNGFKDIEILKDYAGLDRILKCR